MTERGDCYSLSNGRLGRTRRLTACVNGHKNPTIRVKAMEGNVVIVRNLPIYRIVFDIFSGEYHDWNRCRISFIDGNPLNYSYNNMRLESMKGERRVIVSRLESFSHKYEERFGEICLYVCRRFDSISLDDSKDIVSSAFYRLCMEDGPSPENFESYWVSASFRLANKLRERQIRRKEIGDVRIFFDGPEYDYCNVSANEIPGLTVHEKTMVGLLMKGYNKKEAADIMGYKYDWQVPVKLYELAEKLRRFYYD